MIIWKWPVLAAALAVMGGGCASYEPAPLDWSVLGGSPVDVRVAGDAVREALGEDRKIPGFDL